MTPTISILLPTRKRKEALERSLKTLFDLADHPERIELLLGFDDDDQDTLQYFLDNIAPYLDNKQVIYTVAKFRRLGYQKLNEYLNELYKHSTGRWIFFYNDDAAMETQGWDTICMQHDNEFTLIRTETTNGHPYAIFPIIPRKWVELIGHISLHQLNDAWVSQIAWMLDIVTTVPVMVAHERFDLTGANNDSTFTERQIFEGNPQDPRDFNYKTMRDSRVLEAHKLAGYLESQGKVLDHWHAAITGKINVWDKMLASDTKGLMKQWKNTDL